MLGFVKGILSEKGHVKRNTIIQIVIATIAFILLARIYPFSVVESHKTSKQHAFKSTEIKALSGDEFGTNDKKLQTVYFTNDHLYQVKLYMTAKLPQSVSYAQRITFRLYDESFSCLSSEEISLFYIEKKGYLKATPDIDVEQGKAYYYEIIVPEDCEAYIELPTADTLSLDQEENSVLYIDGIVNYDVSLVADFTYSKSLNIVGIIFRYMIIIALSILIYVGIVCCLDLYEQKFTDYSDTIRKYAKIAVSTIIVMFGIFVIIYAVALNKFDVPVLDRSVYTMAVIVGMFYSLSAMWLPRYYPKAKRDFSRPLIWKNYIQTVSFGLLFYALCQYVNADREFYHKTNTRWMLIFLAIAFLMILGGKAMINKFSNIWLVLGWICSAVYCHSLKADANEYLLARLTCGVIVAWGLFILNLIISLRNQSVKNSITPGTVRAYIGKYRLQTVYFGAWVLFSLLMYMNRFEKVWVFTATLPFISLFFIKLTPQVKSRFLNNLTNGIILSFGLVTLFCLIHRPYFYWMRYRYSGIFHTVACNGMYLAIVFAVLIGRLYGRLRDRKSMFSRCFCDFGLIGLVVSFIILTMSRTAFMTIGVCTVLVAALSAFIYKKGIKRITQELMMIAGSVVVCFPLVFTTVRIVPAIVNDPIDYDVEWNDDEWGINLGEAPYSENYMTVERFFNLLLGRFNKVENNEARIIISDDVLLAFNSNSLENIVITHYTEGNRNYVLDSSDDVSNGRLDAFIAYIKAISISGHPDMSVISDDGTEYTHAHNSYLQIFYNFGIIAGVVFLIICVVSLWRSADIAINHGRKYSIYFVPFALIVSFGLLSVTEWAFHPCIPAGFCFLLMQVLLIKEN